jgi:hypothetical protein
MLPERRRGQVFVFGGRYPNRSAANWVFDLMKSRGGVVVSAWNDAINYYHAYIESCHMFSVEHVTETQLHLQVIHSSWMAEFNDIVCPDSESSSFTVKDGPLAAAVLKKAKLISPEVYK